ncbi:glycosyltransferase [Planococcus sp. SSTMD024]|uniref:glycosyltransferase n=1 Tax=Planococcus sp. SSTMD024 TaxID=3242163 RepID=UPI00351DF712
MNKIAYVVLHYITIDLTKNCVDSILNNNKSNYHIVIVDNGSKDNTGIELEYYYRNNNKVDVILLEENLGFAKGNNVGISYAKNILRANFVCCLNNDTQLMQNNFFEIVIKEYKKSEAAVIGPEILLIDNSIQKFPEDLKSLEYYNKELKKLRSEKSIIGRIKKLTLRYTVIAKIKSFKKRMRLQKYNIERKENVIVHGCCFVFTPSFFKKMSGFDPRTFMYREEAILFVQLNKKNLKSVYLPELKIKHLEGMATKAAYNKSEEKLTFIRNTKAKSIEVLISEMKNF